MKKEILLFFLLTLGLSLNAQIAITEVYYDTPFIERYNKNSKAHLGEFIELFNYSTEDIDISGWRLSDNMTSYYFPNGTKIKSNDFLIVAKKISSSYFFDLFPNEKSGNENKVFYQNEIILNNYKDNVRLYAKRLNGINLKNYHLVSSVSWDCISSNTDCNKNPASSKTAANSTNGYNTNFNYYVSSLQVRSNQGIQTTSNHNNSNFENASPFKINFSPEILNYDDISRVDEIITSNYNSLTYDELVDYFFNNLNCDTSVPKISPVSINDVYIEDICFHSDSAGNQDHNENCNSNNNSQTIINPETGKYNLDVISKKIYVSPNPTTGNVSMSWEIEISSIISNAIIVPMNGSSIEIPFQFGNNSASSNISNFSNGFYVVRILLDSGEVITKTIIKI